MPISLAPSSAERGEILNLQVTATNPDAIAQNDTIRFYIYRSKDSSKRGDGFLPTNQTDRNRIWTDKVAYVDVQAATAGSASLEVFFVGTNDGSDPVWSVENTTTPWTTPVQRQDVTEDPFSNASYDLAAVPTGIAPNEVHLTAMTANPPSVAANNFFNVDFTLMAASAVDEGPPVPISGEHMVNVYLTNENGSDLDLSSVNLWKPPIDQPTPLTVDVNGEYYLRTTDGKGHFFITGKNTPIFEGMDFALGNAAMRVTDKLLFVNLDKNGTIPSPTILSAGDPYKPAEGTTVCPIKITQGSDLGRYVAGDYIFFFNKSLKRLLGTLLVNDPNVDLESNFHPTITPPLTKDNFHLTGTNVLVAAVARGRRLYLTRSISYEFEADNVGVNPNQPTNPLGSPTSNGVVKPAIVELGSGNVVDWPIDRYGLTIKAQWNPSIWKPDPNLHRVQAVLYLNGWTAGSNDPRHGQPKSTIVDIEQSDANQGSVQLPTIDFSNISGYGPSLNVPPAPYGQESTIQVQVWFVKKDSPDILVWSPVLGPLVFSSTIPGMD